MKVKIGPFSYLICECGEPRYEHRAAVWAHIPNRKGCEKTGCSVFSAARNAWNAELYARGEFAGVGGYRKQAGLLEQGWLMPGKGE